MIPIYISRRLFALALMAFASLCQGEPLSLQDNDNWPVSLSGHVQVYEDAGGAVTIDQAARLPLDDPSGFRPATAKDLQIGYSRSAWWLSMDIVNDQAERHSLRLWPGTPTLARLDYYIERGTAWSHIATGQKIPLSEQDQESLHRQALALSLGPGERIRIFMRLESSSAINLQPRVYSEAAFLNVVDRTTLWDGILFGGLLALAWSALLIGILSPSFRFLVLSALCVVITLYEATIRNYTKLHLWPEAIEWAHRSAFVLGHLSLFMFMAFVLIMARSEKIHWPARPYYMALAVLELAVAAAALLLDPYFAAYFGLITSLLFGISMPVAAFLLLKNAAPTGRLMLLTGLFILFHSSLRAVERLGFLPQFIVDIGLGNPGTNPIIALGGLATNLAVLTAWIVLIGKQRQAAQDTLIDWQAREQERLKEQIALKTTELNKALQYAEEKSRQKTETLGYIGHDLRAPTATIVGYTRLLGDVLTAEQDRNVKAIERSAQYQLKLIDELLEYAKNELKPLELKPSPTDMEQILDDVLQCALSLCSLQNNQFEMDVQSAIPATTILDSQRLQQVLLNLISNAAKFTRNGHIRLAVHAARDQAGWSLAFSVSDTGRGIDPAKQSIIFSAFEQEAIHQGSAGLGLYIAQSIVENMDGKLTVKSAAGMGSQFSFQIHVEAIGDQTICWSTPLENAAPPAVSDKLRIADQTPMPPAEIRVDLAKLARDGQLTDIEDWLRIQGKAYPGYASFFNEVRNALYVLDLEQIESMALADTGH